LYKTKRRQFLKQATAAGAVVLYRGVIKDSVYAAENSKKSRLVIVRNPDVLGGSDNDSGIKIELLAKMLDQAVTKLTGMSEGKAAWKSLFKPDDIVGIKVNCLGGKGATTHSEVAHAIADALVRAGKPSNIIIWDNTTSNMLGAGYKFNKDGDGVRVRAVDREWEDKPKAVRSMVAWLKSLHRKLPRSLTSPL
jgi:hypothetical protein